MQLPARLPLPPPGRRGRRALDVRRLRVRLSWTILSGAARGLDLSGLRVFLAGVYDDAQPGSPWSVVLDLDEQADPALRGALEAIFLGRAGGATLASYAHAVGVTHAVRRAASSSSTAPAAGG